MSTETNNEGLKRVIGVSGLALAVVNFTIGAGIFTLPAIVGIQLGAFGIFGYLFCSLMLATIMLCYVEIGSRVISSGGSYAYVEAAFGPFAGFIVNWLIFFGWGILSDAAIMNIIADSLSILFPVFLNPLVKALLFFVLFGWMILVNIRGAKQGVYFVSIITITKLIPLLVIIIFGFSHIQPQNLHWEHLPSFKTFGDTTLVLFFAFAGFESAMNASGEIKNPKRTVPLGILLGGLLVLIVYLLLQTVIQGVLGSHINAFKDAPLAAVAKSTIGSAGVTILLVAAALSCFGTVSGDVLASPRLLFAGAKIGLFPKFLARVHPRFATPYWAIIVYSALIFIFSVSGGFKQLAILASCTILLIYLAVILAMIKFRLKKEAVKEKTFKVPGGLIIPVIGIVCIIWLLSHLSSMEIVSTIFFIAAISIIYFMMKKWQTK